jgi:RecJ-like exonuclease
LTDIPDLYVTRLPFGECSPRTEEGIRKLAYIALGIEDAFWDIRGFLDALELLMLRVKRIKPESVGFDDRDKVKPIAIEHVRKRGLKVHWRVENWDNCDACNGKGTIKATGCNGRSYRVECPECDGSGHTEGDEEYLYTDIDGNEWRKAA